MDRLRLMQVFVSVAEAEGFAAAGRALDMSAPAVTRAVVALEDHLGVRLLNRTTRHVRLTDAGARYLEDARQVIADADAADEAAIGVNAEPRGHLAVTAPVLFGRRHVMPGIVDYLSRYPQAEVSALFLDRTVNLLEEGLDVAIRIGRLEDSSLRALKVGEVSLVLCASPDYLKANGKPRQPADLAKHACIVSSAAGAAAHHWRFGSDNKSRPLKIQPRLSVSANDAAIEAAVRGLGITRLISYQIAEELKSGALVRLLRIHEPEPLPVHIVHREGRFANAKVRSFIDLMAEHLRADPAIRTTRR